ncbi:unnamed protein product [Rhizophagus irregularis]|nr:unnamed protein product [Rhizophagus irregularis]
MFNKSEEAGEPFEDEDEVLALIEYKESLRVCVPILINYANSPLPPAPAVVIRAAAAGGALNANFNVVALNSSNRRTYLKHSEYAIFNGLGETPETRRAEHMKFIGALADLFTTARPGICGQLLEEDKQEQQQ